MVFVDRDGLFMNFAFDLPALKLADLPTTESVRPTTDCRSFIIFSLK